MVIDNKMLEVLKDCDIAIHIKTPYEPCFGTIFHGNDKGQTTIVPGGFHFHTDKYICVKSYSMVEKEYFFTFISIDNIIAIEAAPVKDYEKEVDTEG